MRSTVVKIICHKPLSITCRNSFTSSSSSNISSCNSSSIGKTSNLKKIPVDRQLFLEFFDITTFDETEIENAYRKFVLSSKLSHDHHQKFSDSINMSKNININQIPTREDFKQNLTKILNLRNISKDKQHMNNDIKQSNRQILEKTFSLTADDILSMFPPKKYKILEEKRLRLNNAPISSVSTSNSINTSPLPNLQDKTFSQKITYPSSSPYVQPSFSASPVVAIPHEKVLEKSITTDLIDLEYFSETVKAVGSKLDDRIWTVTLSFAFTGASIGIIIPCMPFLVKELALSSSEFGLVVTSFAAAKLLTNIPAAHYVDIVGRKFMMVLGLGLCAMGIGGIGLTLSPYVLPLPTLMTCRFVTGVGVSIFTTGAFMMVNDVSTALNRTRSMAPLMTGFQAGIALGPAFGGIAIQYLGIPFTYVSCGVFFTIIAIANHFFMQETMRKSRMTKRISDDSNVTVTRGISSETINSNNHQQQEQQQQTMSSAFKPFLNTLTAWMSISKSNKKLKRICELNLFYWFALSGVQMTILPLYMVSPTFSLSPTQIGTTFALMSVFSILASQPSAYLADNVLGKIPSIIAGGCFVTSSFCLLPYASSYSELLLIMIPLSIGSTVLQAVPAAYVADITSVSERSNSMSLFRTAGDVGLLFGASAAGAVASMSDFISAIEVNAVIIFSAVLYFTLRSYYNQHVIHSSGSSQQGWWNNRKIKNIKITEDHKDKQ